MIKSHFITVQGKSREEAERKLGEEFNKWSEENAWAVVIQFFEPVRFDRTYGDYNYNTYHTSMTFFYRLPQGLKELRPRTT